MVPIMYRKRCRARVAFAQTLGLVSSHPGPILLYFLFILLLAVAAVMISCALMCATCCIAAIPYLGTVILLPIPVTLGAFSLLFLRQFGPERCVGRLHAAGIFACVDATACTFRTCSRLTTGRNAAQMWQSGDAALVNAYTVFVVLRMTFK
jgi:hypothetical protein